MRIRQRQSTQGHKFPQALKSSLSVIMGLTLLLGASGFPQAQAGEEVKVSPEHFLPEDTIFYLKVGDLNSWTSGISQTSLYKIANEPEVQAFLAGPFAQLALALRKKKQDAPDQAPAKNEDGKKENLDSVVPGPFLISLCNRKTEANQQKIADLAVVIGTKDLDKYLLKTIGLVSEKFLPKLIKEFIDYLIFRFSQGKDDNERYQNAVLSVLPLGPYQLTLTITRKHLIFTTHTELCKRLIDGMSGTLPKKFVDTADFKSCGITGKEQVSAFLNVNAIKELIGRKTALRAGAGDLENLKGIAWSVQMAGSGFESKTGFILGKGQKGLMNSLSKTPIDLSVLKYSPAGCPFAAGIRVKSSELWYLLRKLSKTRSGKGKSKRWEEMEKRWTGKNRNLGQEFSEAFSGDVIVSNQTGATGAPVGALFSQIFFLSLKDQAKAEKLLIELMQDAVARKFPDADAAKVIQILPFEGSKIIYIRKPKGARGMEPKYAITGNALLVSTDMQTIKAALRNSKGPNLLTSERFKTSIGHAGGQVGALFIYVDWGQLYSSAFNMGAQAMKIIGSWDFLTQLGIDINLLPSPEAVTKHLFPSLSTIQRNATGIVLTSRSPLPSIEVLAPPVTAVVSAIAAFTSGAKAEPKADTQKNPKKTEKNDANK